MSLRVLVPGGYGVFGRLLVRGLLETTEAHIVIAGRDVRRAERARRELGSLDRTEALALDLSDVDAFERAARNCFAVACAAGPFQLLPRELPLAAARAGAHWLDIADDPGWVVPILRDGALGREAAERGVTVIPGLSSVPAVSGLLGRWAHARLPSADRGRVILFIGNRNEKGAGATASAILARFRDPAWVELPFGRKRAYRFPTPDEELFRRDLGVEAEFRVALEWGYLGWLTATLGGATTRLGTTRQASLSRALSRISKPFSFLGTDAGCVQVDLWSDGGDGISVAAVAGQPIVILPCAIALRTLLEGGLTATGVAHPASWLDRDDYLARLEARGVRFLVRSAGPRARP